MGARSRHTGKFVGVFPVRRISPFFLSCKAGTGAGHASSSKRPWLRRCVLKESCGQSRSAHCGGSQSSVRAHWATRCARQLHQWKSFALPFGGNYAKVSDSRKCRIFVTIIYRSNFCFHKSGTNAASGVILFSRDVCVAQVKFGSMILASRGYVH